jgi:periplasmic divalent cation tolerance protein
MPKNASLGSATGVSPVPPAHPNACIDAAQASRLRARTEPPAHPNPFGAAKLGKEPDTCGTLVAQASHPHSGRMPAQQEMDKAMKLYYITLSSSEEARKVSRALLEEQLAVCINWFPINSVYRWEGKIVEQTEIVLIVKTQDGYREELHQAIGKHIDYTNTIAEISVESINQEFIEWLDAEVPAVPQKKRPEKFIPVLTDEG